MRLTQHGRTLAAGFTLLPVVLTMSLIGAFAFMLNRDNGLNVNQIGAQSDLIRARYAAEAGLQAANYAIQAQGCSPPRPTLGHAFSPATIDAGGVSTLTLTLSSTSTSAAGLTADLVDTLPAGVVIATTPAVGTTCPGAGAAAAVAGQSTVTLPVGRSIPANGSCTVTVNVKAAAAGAYLNTLPAGALVTSNGNNAVPAVATLTVVPSPSLSSAPLLGQAFSPATINAGGVSTLTITLSNPSTGILGILGAATLNAPLVENLPNGVVIAATPNVSTDCAGSGAPVAVAGQSTVTLPDTRAIYATDKCTLTVNVTAALGGSYINTLPAGALATSKGNNAAPAVAALTVVPPAPLPYPIVSSPVTDNNFGGAAYSAYADSTSGSPRTLTSTGTYQSPADQAAGRLPASVTLTRSSVKVYTSSLPQTWADVQPDGPSGNDTAVEPGSPNTNFGGNSEIRMDYNTRELLIQIGLPPLPTGSVIVGANLMLYKNNGAAGDFFSVMRINANWAEATATWNNVAYDPRPVSTNPFSAGTWQSLDLTTAAIFWRSNPTLNYGVWVRGGPLVATNKWALSSDGNATRRPKLVGSYAYLVQCP